LLQEKKRRVHMREKLGEDANPLVLSLSLKILTVVEQPHHHRNHHVQPPSHTIQFIPWSDNLLLKTTTAPPCLSFRSPSPVIELASCDFYTIFCCMSFFHHILYRFLINFNQVVCIHNSPFVLFYLLLFSCLVLSLIWCLTSKSH
jgi:hypothetical protein